MSLKLNSWLVIKGSLTATLFLRLRLSRPRTLIYLPPTPLIR